MTAVVDFRNGATRIGCLERRKLTWVSGASGVRLTEKATRHFGWNARRPQTVVVTAFGPISTADVSWSAVRGAIAVANAWGFAWGVPTVAVAVRGDETDEQLIEAVCVAAASATPDSRADASYSGEPHITRPRAAA